ncbi:MAG TPA: cupin domain-containing protein [Salinisphaeraceae bacterium]|nr:cupin domain-containing protein [Salinisphaeraceae bacterium]
MNYWAHITPAPDFEVLATTGQSQAATMVLPPNERIGGPNNHHEHADQWLYVLSGTGRAAVGDEAVELGPGALVLIKAGEVHEISNLGDVALETLNIYAPAAY